MFDLGEEEVTIESYRIPWLIWIQLMVLFLLLLLLFSFTLLPLENDATTTLLTASTSNNDIQQFDVDQQPLSNHDSTPIFVINHTHQGILHAQLWRLISRDTGRYLRVDFSQPGFLHKQEPEIEHLTLPSSEWYLRVTHLKHKVACHILSQTHTHKELLKPKREQRQQKKEKRIRRHKKGCREKEKAWDLYSPCHISEQVVKALSKCLGLDSTTERAEDPPDQRDGEEVTCTTSRAMRRPPRPPLSARRGGQVNFSSS